MQERPSAFISYSWDDENHTAWVADFSERLRGDGVGVSIDRWASVPGDQLPQFMETAIRENKFVLIICTPEYKHRSDNRLGGVGYEGDIMTGEILTKGNQEKFLPILRRGEWPKAAPSWLMGKYYVDLRGTPYSDSEYQGLIRILDGKLPEPPPIDLPRRAPTRLPDIVEELILKPGWKSFAVDHFAWGKSREEYDYKKALKGKLLIADELFQEGKDEEVLQLYEPLLDNERFQILHPDWADQPYIRAHTQDSKSLLYLSHCQLVERDTRYHAPRAFELLTELAGGTPFSMRGSSKDRLKEEEARIVNEKFLHTLEHGLEWLAAWRPAFYLFDIDDDEVGLLIERIKSKVWETNYLLKS